MAARLKRTIGALAAVGVVISQQSAHADIVGPYWHDDGITLNTGSNADVVGFWQTLLYSGGWSSGCYIDGIYGATTKTQTQHFQTGVLGFSGTQVDGVVGSNTLAATWAAQHSAPDGNFFRLTTTGGGMWTYYGGGASNAHLGWGGGASDPWKWLRPGGSWQTTSTAYNNITPGPC